jgi:LCP family protein required for cell wall assembly
MADDPSDRDERPKYTRYRSRPRLLDRLRDPGSPELDGLRGLRDDVARQARRPRDDGAQHDRDAGWAGGGGWRPRRRGRGARGGRPWTPRRVIKTVLLAIAGWLALSFVLFMVSAQIETSKSSSAADRALDGAGPLPFAANNVLVLGSDARPKGSKEAGANVVGQPSRSDTIMLIRTGGGANQRLSIPRDTVVDIPGHGPDKINAAYAIGGPALAITTVKQFLGVEVNHLVEVNFDNFPKFIDALGGVNVDLPGCVKANLDGNDQNGGTTLRLHKGSNHLDGKHALGLARVRKNACNPAEDDRDRAARQQLILNAIKHQLISPFTFFRLPWVAWNAPKAIRTDMGGPSLLALFAAIELGGSPKPQVLKASGSTTTPGGGSGLVVSAADKKAAVDKFLGR